MLSDLRMCKHTRKVRIFFYFEIASLTHPKSAYKIRRFPIYSHIPLSVAARTTNVSSKLRLKIIALTEDVDGEFPTWLKKRKIILWFNFFLKWVGNKLIWSTKPQKSYVHPTQSYRNNINPLVPESLLWNNFDSFKAERANIYHREPQSGVFTKLPLRTNRQSADALNIALRIFIEP